MLARLAIIAVSASLPFPRERADFTVTQPKRIRQADLLQVSGATHPLRSTLRLSKCGQEQPCQNGDDRDDYEQLDQRKPREFSIRRQFHIFSFKD
jgi:hypothetical protein